MDTRLAIDGGKPIVTIDMIKTWPVIDDTDKAAVLGVLERKIVCGGGAPETTGLQKEWAEYVGRKHCLATASGTASLHMSLAAAMIGPGDEVLVPAFTFLASASCVLHANAVPVFVDIDENTFNIDPTKIEEKITDRTKAIIPVHLNGLCANMDEIMRIARKHNLIVIEDACQAHGAEFKGKKSGSFGDFAAFSLNSSKNLCGGEGGLFVTDDDTWMMRADMLRMFGDEIDDETKLRVYNASILGYMYRTAELPAAFARAQLKKLDWCNSERIKNCTYLNEQLKQFPGVILPTVSEEYKHVYWMYMVRFDPKAAGINLTPREFRIAMEKALYCEGIQVGQWQTMPVPAQDLFQVKTGYGSKGCPWDCKYYGKPIVYDPNEYPAAQKICDDYTVIAGIHPTNGQDLMALYVEAFKKVYDNLDVVAKHKDDKITAHYSGSLFGAR